MASNGVGEVPDISEARRKTLSSDFFEEVTSRASHEQPVGYGHYHQALQWTNSGLILQARSPIVWNSPGTPSGNLRIRDLLLPGISASTEAHGSEHAK